jgi:hypothetical protein
MTETVTSGSMSGAEKRSDGLLGESDYERRRSLSAPPGLYATALRLDSTFEDCGDYTDRWPRVPASVACIGFLLERSADYADGRGLGFRLPRGRGR